jgi:phosphoglycolate phosphatase-like HAD superfamily hydrolase
VLQHIRLLIADLDYLVFDSAALKTKALRQSLISFADSIPQSARLPDPADLEDAFMAHGSRWLKNLEIDLDDDALVMLETAYEIHQKRLVDVGMGHVFPGLAEVLQNWRDQGASLAIGADVNREYLMAVSDRHQLDKLFANALCTEEFGFGRVDEMLEEAMRLAEVNRSETLVLGTRPEYFEAAHGLDLVAIGCGWGIHRHELLAEADYRACTTADALTVIRRADELAVRY